MSFSNDTYPFFLVMTPIFMSQHLESYEFFGVITNLNCQEKFPDFLGVEGYTWNITFTILILAIQYILPLVILPIVHSKIVIFIR